MNADSSNKRIPTSPPASGPKTTPKGIDPATIPHHPHACQGNKVLRGWVSSNLPLFTCLFNRIIDLLLGILIPTMVFLCSHKNIQGRYGPLPPMSVQ